MDFVIIKPKKLHCIYKNKTNLVIKVVGGVVNAVVGTITPSGPKNFMSQSLPMKQ